MKTIDLPGGHSAVIREMGDMTPRLQRRTQIIALQASPLMKKLNRAGAIKLPNGDRKVDPALANDPAAAVDAMPDIELSEREAGLFYSISDASVYAHLVSWTLDIPLPESLDAVQDIPSPVYDALNAAINALKAPATKYEPSEETLEDPSSPFGESAPSETPGPVAE